jgi:hypothetical protein
MNMERRELLKCVGMAAAGTAAMAASPSASRATAVAATPSEPKTGYEGQLLVNRPRAYAVLEELKLDGLIALNPINVYYLTNTWPFMAKFRAEIPGFATFARDPQQPSFLVTSAAPTEAGAFIIYVLMVALLLWRPAGIFGKSVAEKV